MSVKCTSDGANHNDVYVTIPGHANRDSKWSHDARRHMLVDSSGEGQSCVNPIGKKAQAVPTMACDTNGQCKFSMQADYQPSDNVASAFNGYAQHQRFKVGCNGNDDFMPETLNFAFCGSITHLPKDARGSTSADICLGQDGKHQHPWYAASPDLEFHCDEHSTIHATRRVRPLPKPPASHHSPPPTSSSGGGGGGWPSWLTWLLIGLGALGVLALFFGRKKSNSTYVRR